MHGGCLPNLGYRMTGQCGVVNAHLRDHGRRWRRAVTKNITLPPHRLDVVAPTCGSRKLFAQLADENVESLEPGFVHSSIKLVEQSFSCHGNASAQTKQFEDGVFLIG